MINDAAFNRLKWKKIDEINLDKQIQGLTVTGCEPCGYPLTESMLLYLHDEQHNKNYVLDIGIKDDEENTFYTNIAKY